MRTKKKRHKFSTLIISKNSVYVFFIAVIILLAICFIQIRPRFSSSVLKEVIRSVVFCFPSKDYIWFDYRHPSKTLGGHYVLAESFPILKAEALQDSVAKDGSEKTNSSTEEVTVQLPANTLPIKTMNITGKRLQLKNETTYSPDVDTLLTAALEFNAPEILIVHTHASESYKNDDSDYYIQGESDRNLDTNLNMVRIGSELTKELTNCGYKVTHAKDINDYPSYNQSYSKTLQVINYHIKNNPNIQVVIDLHRDSAVRSDGTKLKFTTDIEGEKVAQAMIVCGTNQAGLENDLWQENLKFALKLQNYMETNYKGLARPLNLRQERFNTHATKGSMIIEVGTSGNTLTESLATVKYLSKTIDEVLKPYK